MSFLKAIFEQTSFIGKLLIVFTTLVFFLSIGSAISLLVTPAFGDDIVALKITQAVLSIFGFIFPAVICACFFDKNAAQYLSVSPQTKTLFYLLAAMIVVSAMPAINFTADLNEKIVLPEWLSHIEKWMKQQEATNNALTERFLSATSWSGFLGNLVVMALIPAFSEELFFRGLLQKTIAKTFGTHAGIWLSALIFSAIHLQFYGFFPRMFLGAIFGYFVYWSGSILPSVVAHFINNATVVTLSFFCSQQTIDEFSHIGTANQWPIAFVSFGVCGLLLWFFRRYRIKADDDAHVR